MKKMMTVVLALIASVTASNVVWADKKAGANTAMIKTMDSN